MRNVESPKDFLDAPHRFIFNHSLISSVVSSLSPSTSIIFIGSHNLTDPQASSVNLPLPQSLSSVEPIYGTQYEVSCFKIDQDVMHSLSLYLYLLPSIIVS